MRPASGEIFVKVEQVVVLCSFDQRAQRQVVGESILFQCKSWGPLLFFRSCVCVCFCATGTLPAEALLRRVKTGGH